MHITTGPSLVYWGTRGSISFGVLHSPFWTQAQISFQKNYRGHGVDEPLAHKTMPWFDIILIVYLVSLEHTYYGHEHKLWYPIDTGSCFPERTLKALITFRLISSLNSVLYFVFQRLTVAKWIKMSTAGMSI